MTGGWRKGEVGYIYKYIYGININEPRDFYLEIEMRMTKNNGNGSSGWMDGRALISPGHHLALRLRLSTHSGKSITYREMDSFMRRAYSSYTYIYVPIYTYTEWEEITNTPLSIDEQ